MIQRTSALIIISLLLSACGQSGGLYLPKDPPPANPPQSVPLQI